MQICILIGMCKKKVFYRKFSILINMFCYSYLISSLNKQQQHKKKWINYKNAVFFFKQKRKTKNRNSVKMYIVVFHSFI